MTTMGATTFSGFARRKGEFVSDFASVIHNYGRARQLPTRAALHAWPRPKWRAKHQSRLRFDSGSVPTDPAAPDVAGVRKPL
jgi:hypothetical protein